jgi:hypothetical protein
LTNYPEIAGGYAPYSLTTLHLTKSAIKKIVTPDAGRMYHHDEKTPGLVVCMTPAGSKTFYVVRRVAPERSSHRRPGDAAYKTGRHEIRLPYPGGSARRHATRGDAEYARPDLHGRGQLKDPMRQWRNATEYSIGCCRKRNDLLGRSGTEIKIAAVFESPRSQHRVGEAWV